MREFLEEFSRGTAVPARKPVALNLSPEQVGDPLRRLGIQPVLFDELAAGVENFPRFFFGPCDLAPSLCGRVFLSEVAQETLMIVICLAQFFLQLGDLFDSVVDDALV